MPENGRTTTRIPGERPPVPEELLLRARRVARKLARAYPDAHCALDFETPLDLYVATVLSAQCTDERVNKVTPELFRRCRNVEDYLALGPAGLEEIIRSTGFFRAKARNILAGCQRILETHDGALPQTMEQLIQIPGCGRKTANVILGNSFGIPGITVDTHMGRIARRLEFTTETDPVKVEAELQQLVPEKDWTMFSHRVISHGRAVCDARRPLCEGCPIRSDCPYPEQSAKQPPAMTVGAGRARAEADRARSAKQPPAMTVGAGRTRKEPAGSTAPRMPLSGSTAPAKPMKRPSPTIAATKKTGGKLGTTGASTQKTTAKKKATAEPGASAKKAVGATGASTKKRAATGASAKKRAATGASTKKRAATGASAKTAVPATGASAKTAVPATGASAKKRAATGASAKKAVPATGTSAKKRAAQESPGSGAGAPGARPKPAEPRPSASDSASGKKAPIRSRKTRKPRKKP